MWKDASSTFTAGNYPAAAEKLKAIITSSAATGHLLDDKPLPPASPKQQWLEPVFYLLGASYFNAKDWSNAIFTLAKYRQLFPYSPRATQVLLSLAQAEGKGERYGDAAGHYKALLTVPDYHQRALLLLMETKTRAGQPDEAIALGEKEKAAPQIDPNFLEKINLALLRLYLAQHEDAKAVDVLRQLDEDIEHVADTTAFNTMAVRLGDTLLEKKDIDGALNCYRRVRDNQQIIDLQKKQIDQLQQQRAANLVRVQATPLLSFQLQADNKDIDDLIAWNRKILAQYETLPPILPPLFLRIGRAYSFAGQLWEAAVVYREIMRRYPKSAESEMALYASIAVFEQLKQNDRGLALGQDYLTLYPHGKFADTVAFLRGVLAYNEEDFDKALDYFNTCLKDYPQNPRREKIEVILGDIPLRQAKFDDALAGYARYLKEYPQGQLVETAEYRSGLALLFAGKDDEARAALNHYLQKYAQGVHVADAEYRLMVLRFAGKDYDGVLADGAAWQRKHGAAQPLAEVLSLMGDCYASENKNDAAVKLYIQSYKTAQTVEVLNYSIFAAAKILQKEAKWADIAAMFQEFVKDNPDHPTAVSALFWIGRADIKLGQVDEGRDYLANTAKKYLNDPSREAVDQIITELAQLFGHRLTPPPVVPAATGNPSPLATSAAPAPAHVSAAPATNATPLIAPPPAPTPDPAADLVAALTVPDLALKPTAQARLLFAKAELARIHHKFDVEQEALRQIARQSKPEDLSPLLLGQAGDCLVQSGEPDAALPFYNQLLDYYSASPLVDYAYNGLGQIAFDQKDYVKAERYYGKALDKGLASAKLKEITLGEARSLLALNRPAEAKPLFEQVAGNRAWRGEATALSVYSLGEVQMALGKYAEANAYYQRVFVAYQKYPAIQAKAYLESGHAFEKLGRVPEAVNTYSEMLRNSSLSPYPEFTAAQHRLDQLPTP